MKTTRTKKTQGQQKPLAQAHSGPRTTSNDNSKGRGPDLVEMVGNLMMAAGMDPDEAATFLVECAIYFGQHSTETPAKYDDWKRSAASLLEASRWPWPTRDAGLIEGRDDGQTWADLDEWLRERGSSLEARVEELRRNMEELP